MVRVEILMGHERRRSWSDEEKLAILSEVASGAVFAFRGRRGDRVKLLMWDDQGFCLFCKILEKGRFPWPSTTDGTARLTAAQLVDVLPSN